MDSKSARPNVPTAVTVVPGTQPTLNPGAHPTLNPGTHPTLNPGTHPTLNPGTHPTLSYVDADGNPYVPGPVLDDEGNPVLDADGNPVVNPPVRDAEGNLAPGLLPSLDQGELPSLDQGELPSLDQGELPTLTGGSVSTWGDVTTTTIGHKSTHVAVEFGLGGVTPYVGYSEQKKNNSAAKSKTTHYGFSGSLGDTGMSYLVAARNVKKANGMKSNPWLFNVSKGLGGGATVIFEHSGGNKNASGMKVSAKSRVGLHVSF